MDVASIKQYFEDIWRNGKPLACLFRSSSSGYLLDTGTNKILSCSEPVFALIQTFLDQNVPAAIEAFIKRYDREEFLKAAQEIRGAIEEENILRTLQATQFGLSDHFKDVDQLLNTTVQSINLEVCQDCNNRCLYCIYNSEVKSKRDHGYEQMPLSVAKKAIDFLKCHSAKSQSAGIGFYGGETLVRFPFLQSCIRYAQEVFTDNPPHYNITTNGTLITPAIAQYLLQENVAILVSIDGPEAIHNRYRKDLQGNGTFRAAMLGLKILFEKYQEIRKGSIAINLVYAPPYSGKKLDEITRYFKEVPWLPPDINIFATYPSDGTIPQHLVTAEDLLEDVDMGAWAFEKYRQDYEQADTIVKNVMEQKLARILQRPILKEPFDCYALNGCCVPGQRKNYISTDGAIHVCEKISTFAPVLGHVDTGFDLKALKRFYIDEYAGESIGDCATCWAVRLCDICYTSALNDMGELDIQKKRKYCHAKRKTLKVTLGQFATCMEEKPNGLDYLYHYEIS